MLLKQDWGSAIALGLGLAAVAGKSVRGLTCYCEHQCPNGQPNGTCITSRHSQCFSAIQEEYNEETGEYEPVASYGCLAAGEQGFLQCKGGNSLYGLAIQCCNTDMCNKEIHPIYTPHTTTTPPPKIQINSVPYIAFMLSMITCLLISAIVIGWFYIRYRRREKNRLYALASTDSYISGNSNLLQTLIGHSSGSGSGIPLLVQRTIAKQIRIECQIGEGRFGKVCLANWRGEHVAVKIFTTINDQSWLRETEIYQTVLLRHENILGFIAADLKVSAGGAQMMLITEYHKRGSLHDYLKENTIDAAQLIIMARSIASGLAHLHEPINGTHGKPCIAHRDIKSRNILVKADGECCIADFALAVRYDGRKNEIDIAPNSRVGTRRYMAPEVVNDTIDVTSFSAFKAADMYSTSLVLWELCRRCRQSWPVGGSPMLQVEDYILPYSNLVSPDPSIEDMRLVLIVQGARPDIPMRWRCDHRLRVISEIIQECWHQNPSVRLPALRVMKTLRKLEDSETSESSIHHV
ncbi:bone morphogenetic protein receptor type-1B-like [Daktulosphaira vitifoliae]|uniref:bone morphogenetic protein receptor type-1B-like n=1 Tax=Daktulosphaira vitifoliae TaxID=58002 RepID=UPI0021A9D22B|nr:bone morphogenetic protein receptor type-1B-like [Daktulosphaira vitifoliae]